MLDGNQFNQTPFEFFQSTTWDADKKIIIGTTSEEGALFVYPEFQRPVTKDQFIVSNSYIKKEKYSHTNSQNWSFQQHRFSCHHQQCMQSSTKLKLNAFHTLLMMTAEFLSAKRPVLTINAGYFAFLSYIRPIFIKNCIACTKLTYLFLCYD